MKRTKAAREVDAKVKLDFLPLLRVGNVHCAAEMQNLDGLLVQVPLVVLAMLGHCLVEVRGFESRRFRAAVDRGASDAAGNFQRSLTENGRIRAGSGFSMWLQKTRAAGRLVGTT